MSSTSKPGLPTENPNRPTVFQSSRDRPSSRARPNLSLSQISREPTQLPHGESVGGNGKLIENEVMQKPGHDAHEKESKSMGNFRKQQDTQPEGSSSRFKYRQCDNEGPRSPHISGMDRFPAIIEETSYNSSPVSETTIISPTLSGAQTASTESNQTIKGSHLQTPAASQSSTPAYPFPPMNAGLRIPSGIAASAYHRPFTDLSPTTIPPTKMQARSRAAIDRLVSGETTPSSMNAFIPPSKTGSRAVLPETVPNLSEIILRLSSEPSLEQWWASLTRDLQESYGAERVTLAVPSDATDVENVPWAQIACFENMPEDNFSKRADYPRSIQNNVFDSSIEDLESAKLNSTKPSLEEAGSIARWGEPTKLASARPKLESRHSFAGFIRKVPPDKQDNSPLLLKAGRSSAIRVGSYTSCRDEPQAESNTKLSIESLRKHEEREALGRLPTEDVYGSRKPSLGRVLNVLQPLESEADPLLTSAGAVQMLERCKTAVLTREYIGEPQFGDFMNVTSKRN
ncbi:hypothetical protein MMC06_001527 [Schaereria dolodes]|nr:hypothetical protein [Schaereria dolodes]